MRKYTEEPTERYKYDTVKNPNSCAILNWVGAKLTLPKCNGTLVRRYVRVPPNTEVVHKVKLVTSAKRCFLLRGSLDSHRDCVYSSSKDK